MSTYFENIKGKLDFVGEAVSSSQEILGNLKNQIREVTAEIEALSNSPMTPRDGETLPEALVRRVEELAVLEDKRSTLQTTLELSNTLGSQFPYTPQEIQEEFTEVTKKYKEEQISFLVENALAAKNEYLKAIELLRKGYGEQEEVAREVMRISKEIMGQSIWVEQMRSLPQEIFINREHQKER